MPYHVRHIELHNTLISFNHWYKDRDDYEVIIVEDIKNQQKKGQHRQLLKIINQNKDINIKLIEHNIDTCNPSTHFNHGVRKSSGEFVIITNPECFHEVDILSGLDGHFDKRKDWYVICACKNGVKQDKRKTFNDFNKNVTSRIKWFQFSNGYSSCLHFCSAMSRESYDSIGGFDEAYSKGVACDDSDFKLKIKKSEDIVIKEDDALIVNHQNHNTSSPKPNNFMELYNINRVYFEKKWGIEPKTTGKPKPRRKKNKPKERKPEKKKVRITAEEDQHRQIAKAKAREDRNKMREQSRMAKIKELKAKK